MSPCASCRDKSERRMNLTVNSVNKFPFSSNDIQVISDDQVRKFQASDWPESKHKLLIWLPDGERIVCATELGAMSQWYDKFAELNCELILCSSDNAHAMLDWFKSESSLTDRPFKAFSSYLMANRLGIVDNGRVKRSSVFIMNDGEIVRIGHFDKVGRSFKDLHRQLYGYSSQSFCSEGWEDPSDSILEYRGEKLPAPIDLLSEKDHEH